MSLERPGMPAGPGDTAVAGDVPPPQVEIVQIGPVRPVPVLSAAATVLSAAPVVPRMQRGLQLDLGERRVLVVVGDAAAVVVAAVATVLVWSVVRPGAAPAPGSSSAWAALLAASWLVAAAALGSYGTAERLRVVRSVALPVASSALLLGAYAVGSGVSRTALLPRPVVVAFAVAAAPLAVAARRGCARMNSHARLVRRVIVVGAGGTARETAALLNSCRDFGYQLVGFVDDDAALLVEAERATRSAVLGPSSLLTEIAERHRAAEIVLALRGPIPAHVLAAVTECHSAGLVVWSAAEFHERLTGRIPTRLINDSSVLALPLVHRGASILYRSAKRVVDLAGALLGLAALALVLPFAALAIKLDSRGPVFYSQTRTGRSGRHFVIWKLRSMRTDAERDAGPRWAADGDPRLTRVGRLLRRSKLDEFPQFWNVLKGEMSLVGPRPERPEFEDALASTIPFYNLRHAVKPGLAGWAAINHGYVDAIEKAAERLEYDLYYIKHQSLWLDVQIMLRALTHVVLLKGR